MTLFDLPELPSALLDVRDVSVRYRAEHSDTLAITNVRLSVRSGERIVVVGPSGCGKTTLLKAIAGFLPIANGEITLRGKPIGPPSPDRLMVFQEFDQLFGWRTVKRNVELPLRTARGLSRPEAAARALDALRKVKLTEFAGAFPHTLSGGQKQRAAIARAMAMEPEILLMDEPFGSLDALTRTAMQTELVRLLDMSGTTLILVTHSIEEAIAIGDRIVVLSGRPGRIQEVVLGLPGESRYAPTVTALRQQLDALVMQEDVA